MANQLPKYFVMRSLTMVALSVVISMVLLSTWSQGSQAASLRAANLADEDEEFHSLVPRPRHYRDYGFMQRVIRDDNMFDDYGHMRFGRSND